MDDATNFIHPQDLIEELSLEGLNKTSDEYFQNLPNPLMQMGKPFTMPANLPHTLEGLAMMCKGLRLTPTMSVVDFGAGTCWLSRYLAQMGCDPIAVDVSPAALELGKKLFNDYPLCGHRLGTPTFLVYDGHRIGLPDASVDRIICFDSFHHVPNPEEVLAEFYRILKPSGLIGFHEPGLGHSQTLESQKEMRDFKVLENDVDKQHIFEAWQELGPGEFRTIFHSGLDLEYDKAAYDALFSNPLRAQSLLRKLLRVNRVDNVFFLSKGPFICDSRVREGLAAKIDPERSLMKVRAGAEVSFDVTLTNTGQNRWLTSGEDHFGVVQLGGHLLSARGDILSYEFLRAELPGEIMPGETCVISMSFTAPAQAGEYILELDMVAGYVCWFVENAGIPAQLQIETE